VPARRTSPLKGGFALHDCTKYQPPFLCSLAAPASAISASTDQLYRTCLRQLSVPAFGISCVFRASAISTSVDLLYSTSFRRLSPLSPVLVSVTCTGFRHPYWFPSPVLVPSPYWFPSPVPVSDTSTRFRHQYQVATPVPSSVPGDSCNSTGQP
jgi:hypothetical protein